MPSLFVHNLLPVFLTPGAGWLLAAPLPTHARPPGPVGVAGVRAGPGPRAGAGSTLAAGRAAPDASEGGPGGVISPRG